MVKSGLFLISLISILLIQPSISANNISIEYPKEIEIGEEFSIKVKIFDFGEGIYDVKIDLNGDGQRVAKILNNGLWKSTYYYINDIIKNEEEKDFTLKIENYTGNITFEVKIKDSSNSIATFSGYNIISKESTQEPLHETNETEINQTEEQEINETQEEQEDVEEKAKEQTKETIKKSEEQIDEVLELEPIVLSPKDIKSKDDKEISEKSKYTIYGLVIFCILLTTLMVLRKKELSKNEFNRRNKRNKGSDDT